MRALKLAGLAGLVALAVSAPAASAAVTQVDVPRTASVQLAKIRAKSTAPILLPSILKINGRNVKAYPAGGGSKDGWNVSLAYVKNCRGANACFMADFSAERGGHPFGRLNVTLRGGVRAHYQPISCGGSCAPASIGFVTGGVYYEYQVKDPAGKVKPALVALANNALAFGPR